MNIFYGIILWSLYVGDHRIIQMGLVTTMKKKCYICNKDFSPEKRHPYQKVCNKDKCRREHKRRYCQKWRKKNPNYFKGWKRNIEVNKKWREKNPDYYKK